MIMYNLLITNTRTRIPVLLRVLIINKPLSLLGAIDFIIICEYQDNTLRIISKDKAMVLDINS